MNYLTLLTHRLRLQYVTPTVSNCNRKPDVIYVTTFETYIDDKHTKALSNFRQICTTQYNAV